MSGDDLFDDVETGDDVNGTGDEVTDPAVPIGETITPEQMMVEAVSGISNRELHSAGIGFGPLFIGLVLLGLPAIWTTISNLLLALSVVLGMVAVVGLKTKSKKLSRQVRLEPHWMLGGQVVAAVLGVACLALVRVVALLGGLVA